MQVFDTVLLIDDDEVSNLMNQKLISELGLVRNVVCKTSAKEAFEYVEESYYSMRRLPSLILADIVMPDMDGFQFLEQIKNSNLVGVKRIPTAILTESQKESDKVMCSLAGLQFISKPLNPAKFFDIIHNTALHTLSIERQKAVIERQRSLEEDMKRLIARNNDIKFELERIKAFRQKLETQLKVYRSEQ